MRTGTNYAYEAATSLAPVTLSVSEVPFHSSELCSCPQTKVSNPLTTAPTVPCIVIHKFVDTRRKKQDNQHKYNVMLRRVCAPIVGVGKQQALRILNMCL